MRQILLEALGVGLEFLLAADQDQRALVFVEVGRLPQVIRKFGRWLDLVYMQRLL